jgi:hypothetical protein
MLIKQLEKGNHLLPNTAKKCSLHYNEVDITHSLTLRFANANFIRFTFVFLRVKLQIHTKQAIRFSSLLQGVFLSA